MAAAVPGLTPYLPTQPRFLGGAALGTLAGSLFLLPMAPVLFDAGNGAMSYFRPVLLAAPFMLCLFLSAGWPLFVAFRAAGWPRPWMAGLAGALIGGLVSLSLPFGDRGLAAVCLGGAGVVAAMVCWRFIYWPARPGAVPGRRPG
jgi:hypothetical protein